MRTFKHALRALVKSPFLTAVAVLSIALGIGANAAIFSIFEQILLRPLPVEEPDRLVNLEAPGPKPGSTSCNNAGDCDAVFSYPMFRDLQVARTGFVGIAAHRLFGANLAFQGQTLNGDGTLVSGSYFSILGLEPALGRLIGPSDDETVGAHPVVVLSHNYWQNHLGGRGDIIDQTLVVNGYPFTIIGVTPEGFDGTTLGSKPHVFVPITMRPQLMPTAASLDDRTRYWVYLFGRLEPGTSIEQAAAATNGVYRSILAEVEAGLQVGMSDQTMARFLAKEIVMEDGRRGQSTVQDEGRVPLYLLFAIAGFVLLIACANVANLLLARGANRSMEVAVRLSLGAGRWRVVSQLLAESLILALLGAAVSLLVARWTLVVIASLLPPEAVATFEFGINPTVALFAGLLAVGTGLLFGLFPAFHSTRSDLVTTIRANAGQIAGARSAARFRSSLVVAQIALAMALLASAGLFLKSLVNLSRVDLGLQVENVITFGVSPELNGYEPAQSRAFFQRLETALAATPGFSTATASLVPILANSNWGTSITIEGISKLPDEDDSSNENVVGAGYFRTLGIPLLRGREFTESDALGAPKVAIVNEAFARKFDLEGDVLGRYVAIGGDEPDHRIVGLVQDAKYSEVKAEVPPQIFTPYLQNESIGSMAFYARTSLDPSSALRAIFPLVASLDPNLPVEDLKTMPQQVRENIFLDRMIGTMSAGFAAVATLLAAIGLYGVLAYTVTQRTREIGVRMALGADARDVRTMVLRQVGRMIAVGGLVGVVAALALARGAGSLLYGLEAWDPVVMVSATSLLVAVALLAGFLPARRASRVDPVEALRFS